MLEPLGRQQKVVFVVLIRARKAAASAATAAKVAPSPRGVGLVVFEVVVADDRVVRLAIVVLPARDNAAQRRRWHEEAARELGVELALDVLELVDGDALVRRQRAQLGVSQHMDGQGYKSHNSE